MTDEKLLRNVAYAAGYKVKAVFIDADDNFQGLIIGQKFTKERIRWNPLQSDSEVFALFVMFHHRLEFREYSPSHCAPGVTVFLNEECFSEDWQNHPDRNAAFRRAIVRAIAAIGEKM